MSDSRKPVKPNSIIRIKRIVHYSPDDVSVFWIVNGEYIEDGDELEGKLSDWYYECHHLNSTIKRTLMREEFEVEITEQQWDALRGYEGARGFYSRGGRSISTRLTQNVKYTRFFAITSLLAINPTVK